jgi:Tfp pilus assembly protein PilN
MVFDQINLSTRERIDNRIRYVAYGGMAAVVIVISLLNLAKGYQIYKERTAYQEKTEQLQQQAQKLQTAGTGGGEVSQKNYRALMNAGLAINRLIALDLFPWVKVLDALEKALPDAVVIDAFRPDEGFARIYLEGHTDSLEKLVRFQERLEASDLFAAVVLENMGLGDNRSDNKMPNARSRMKFKLHCRLRLDQALPVETHGALWRALESSSRSR